MHNNFLTHRLNWATFLLWIFIAGNANLAMAEPDPTITLRAKYDSLTQSLQKNQFKRPLVLESTETPQRLQGDIYAVVAYPFKAVNAGLNNPDHWCDVLLLHINTKYCHATERPSDTTLVVNIGKKTPEKLADAARVKFTYEVVATTPEYVEIMLHAADGPLGTSNYRILLEAVAISDTKTFLHLTYAYGMNLSGRLALQTYLATIGHDKVGFTKIGTQNDGEPNYIGGVRGMIERNTMRYYLAIDTFLQVSNATPAQQPEKRFQNWFTAVEQYPQQLHEMDRNHYIEMKRAEYSRQQTVR